MFGLHVGFWIFKTGYGSVDNTLVEQEGFYGNA